MSTSGIHKGKICDRYNKEAKLNQNQTSEKHRSTGALHDSKEKRKRGNNNNSDQDSASTDVDAGEEMERLKNQCMIQGK